MAKKKQKTGTSANTESAENNVTLIQDPFRINTLEITHAQQQDEAIAEEAMPEDSMSEDLASLESPSLEDAASEWVTDSEMPAETEIDSDPAPVFAPIEEQEAQLEKIAQAVAEQQVSDLQTMAEQTATEAENSAEVLAQQIAEDQALIQEMAKEAEEAEKMEALDEELLAALPKKDEDGNLDLIDLQSCIEALLFMSDKPVSMNRIREWIGAEAPLPAFQEAMSALKDCYKQANHGIELVEVAGGYQLRTKPIRAALAKKLAKVQSQRLSTGAMETLAIIAYRQPVMKEEIDQIRGVDSSYFVRGLLDKKLVKITGRSELPGRPMLYSTTDEFLEVFGLKDLSSMPALRELESMVPSSESAGAENEDPRVKQMRQLVAQMKTDTSTSLIYDPREDEKILKEIRERVGAIPTSTPYLEQQKEAEKAAALAAQTALIQPELPESGAINPETESVTSENIEMLAATAEQPDGAGAETTSDTAH